MKQNSILKKIAVSLTALIVITGLISFGWWLGVNSASQNAADNDTSKDNSSKPREAVDPRFHKIVDYQHADADVAQCAAIMPECGWCNGKVINKQCYVNDEQLAEYRQYVPDVKVEHGVADPS